MTNFKIENLIDILRLKEVTRTEKVKNILNHNCVIEDFFIFNDLLVINMVKKSTGYQFQFIINCTNIDTYELYVAYKYQLFGEKSWFDWRELKWLSYSTLNQIKKIISDVFGDREFCRVRVGYAPDSIVLEEKGNSDNYLILDIGREYLYKTLTDWLENIGIHTGGIHDYISDKFLPPHLKVDIRQATNDDCGLLIGCEINDYIFKVINTIQRGGEVQ